MVWNSSFYLLGFDEKTIVLFNGSVYRIYSHAVQYAILRRFFGREEVSLDRLREVYENTYSLHEILEAFYSLVQDKVLVPGTIFKIAIGSPEWPLLCQAVGGWGLTNVVIDEQQPDMTIFVISDLRGLQLADLLKIKSNRFTCVWVFGKELKLLPVFDKADTGPFFSFLNRMKRVFYSQLLTVVNYQFSDKDFLPVPALSILLEYLPEFISSEDGRNTLLSFDVGSLEIKRIPVHESVFHASPQLSHDILNERNEPADVISVFKQLSFHGEGSLGLIDRLQSEKTPLGGWMSSGGIIYRSNKVNTETFFSRTRASGNGLTKEESEAKAFCETLERYAQIFREHEDEYIIDTYKNLGSEAFHPNEILLYSPDQYCQNRAHNQTGKPLMPFDENIPIAWSYVKDLSDTTSRRIPTFLLYLGVPPEDTASEQFFKWITNGTAAGSTLETARLHALYELVERDAYAIWWYNRLGAKGIDNRCISHLKIVASALEAHASLGKNVYVFDITQDIPIPTVAVVSDYLPGTYIVSCGSNICFEKACEKTFSELNQLYIHHLGKKTLLDAGQMADVAVTLDQHRPHPPAWSLDRNTLSAAAELSMLETEIRKKGLDIFYKDLSRNDVLLPVVKAVVPGMRDMDTRFAPGRLFTTVNDLHGYLPTENDLRNFNIF